MSCKRIVTLVGLTCDSLQTQSEHKNTKKLLNNNIFTLKNGSIALLLVLQAQSLFGCSL